MYILECAPPKHTTIVFFHLTFLVKKTDNLGFETLLIKLRASTSL